MAPNSDGIGLSAATSLPRSKADIGSDGPPKRTHWDRDSGMKSYSTGKTREPPVLRTFMQRSWSPRRILIAAQQIELRARIARLLLRAGCSVELPGGRKRALELAAGGGIEAAIVVHSAALAGLVGELRDFVTKAIGLGHPADEILRPAPSSRGIHPLCMAAGIPSSGQTVPLSPPPVRQAEATVLAAGEQDFRYRPRPPSRNRKR